MPDLADRNPYVETTLGFADVQDRLDSTKRPDRISLHSTILPGPTGELNQLSTYGRGVVLCLGPTLEQTRAQAKEARKAGCSPLIIAPDAQPAEGLSGTMPLTFLETLKGFDAVVLWANEDALRKARFALANRGGALLPLIDANDVVNRCILERHICIDTTAAGGNAALLAAES